MKKQSKQFLKSPEETKIKSWRLKIAKTLKLTTNGPSNVRLNSIESEDKCESHIIDLKSLIDLTLAEFYTIKLKKF